MIWRLLFMPMCHHASITVILYIGISQGQLSCLQLVKNVAARLLTRTKKRERITPVLVSLHWLPVEFRIYFKSLLMIFKALHGISPKYIADLLIPYKNTRTKTRLKSKGDRAFSVATPRLWNPLPMHIKYSHSVDAFKSRLKSYLFSRAFRVD